jgi:HK97 gp10 family phage protein
MAEHPGIRIHRNRLQRMRRATSDVYRSLYESGEVVRKDAADSIKAGAISGPLHVPSDPGEPPNADTHQLDMSIDVRVNASKKSVSVTSEAPYSAFLEFGTSKIAARPFMRPALERNRNRIVLGVVNAVNRSIRIFKTNPGRSRANYEDY